MALHRLVIARSLLLLDMSVEDEHADLPLCQTQKTILPRLAVSSTRGTVTAMEGQDVSCLHSQKWSVIDAPTNIITSRISNPRQTGLVANKKTREPYGQKEALMFVLHFIGDMHQPLHIEEEDRGGNGIRVCFDNRCGRTNLHSVWDTDIPYKYRGLHHGIHKQVEKEAAALWAEELYTQQISNGTDIKSECSNVRAAQECALIWASEANSYICSYVLAKGEEWLKENDLGGEYYKGGAPIVEKMIAKAGLRLGGWLNALAEARSADITLIVQ